MLGIRRKCRLKCVDLTVGSSNGHCFPRIAAAETETASHLLKKTPLSPQLKDSLALGRRYSRHGISIIRVAYDVSKSTTLV